MYFASATNGVVKLIFLVSHTVEPSANMNQYSLKEGLLPQSAVKNHIENHF